MKASGSSKDCVHILKMSSVTINMVPDANSPSSNERVTGGGNLVDLC